MAIEAMYRDAVGPRLSGQRQISSAKLVQAWLARPGCGFKLHFIPVLRRISSNRNGHGG